VNIFSRGTASNGELAHAAAAYQVFAHIHKKEEEERRRRRKDSSVASWPGVYPSISQLILLAYNVNTMSNV